MSGLPVNTKSQAAEYRKQYMSYLALEAQNDAFNLMANQVFKQTGQPSRPMDTRTTTEKLADIEELKVRLLNEFMSITDGQNALEAVTQLTVDEIIFASQKINMITSDLRAKFARGVPALALVSYIRALRTKELATNGVSFEAQEATAQAILNALQAGRVAGAPLPPFAPPVGPVAPSVPPSRPPMPPVAPVAPVAPPAAPRSGMSFMEELQQRLAQRNQPQPVQPAPPAFSFSSGQRQRTPGTDQTVEMTPEGRISFADAIRLRSQQMGILPSEIERRGQEQEQEQLAARRGEVPATKLTEINTKEEFLSQSWLTLRKWFDDWSILIPDMRTAAEDNDLVAKRGKDAGRLRYTPPGGAQVAKSALMPAFEIYLRDKDSVAPVQGKGMTRRALAPSSRFPSGRPILGYGLGKKNVSIDMTKGIQNTMPTYVPFGKFIINPNKLSRGILEIKTLKGGKLQKYPMKEISPSLTKIMKRMLDDRMPDEYDFKEMDLQDQQFLYDLSKDAKINERLNIPTPKLSKEGEEMNRFEILKGQIQSGNDNREMIKEFKTMILKFSNDGRLKKSDTREILMDLTALGY